MDSRSVIPTPTALPQSRLPDAAGISAVLDHAYDDMTWCFAIQRQLPCITGTAPRIRIHNVLNAVDVPEHAFVTIIFHEMLDLEIPAVRAEGGELNGHPPEFFAAERKRSPNLDASWGVVVCDPSKPVAPAAAMHRCITPCDAANAAATGVGL
jgi:hypothetical protein